MSQDKLVINLVDQEDADGFQTVPVAPKGPTTGGGLLCMLLSLWVCSGQ